MLHSSSSSINHIIIYWNSFEILGTSQKKKKLDQERLC